MSTPALEPTPTTFGLEAEQCYRAVQSRDGRFDGWFVVAVHTTGIYCRPSCPARTPQRQNVSFFPTSATAQQRGFRACKRCRPDASPGSPEWNRRADAVGRAMRLIADGVVDREGVHGLARRLGYSDRHVTRLLTDELGAGPLAIARAQRAQVARILIETTDMAMADVAFAAGFSSVRQFNDTVRDVFVVAPSELRAAGRRRREPDVPVGRGISPTTGISLRLAVRAPFAAEQVIAFLAARAVTSVEASREGSLQRALRLPHGDGVVALTPITGAVACTLHLDDVADLQAAVQRCRRLLDLDADPMAVDAVLGADVVLGPLVAVTPGLRMPGAVDGFELLVRAIIGQQVSVSGARTIAGRLAHLYGEDLQRFGITGIDRAFPSAEALAAVDPDLLPMPRARGRALVAVSAAVADGRVVIDAGADRADLVRQLVALPGIGAWTAQYVAMRAAGDPDVFMPTDLGVRHALERLGRDGSPRAASRLAEAWSPWRSYAVHHLWHSLSNPVTEQPPHHRSRTRTTRRSTSS